MFKHTHGCTGSYKHTASEARSQDLLTDRPANSKALSFPEPTMVFGNAQTSGILYLPLGGMEKAPAAGRPP